MFIIKRNLTLLLKKIQSVILLCVTIFLLFYYTFQNEIDMLNSYAETEYIPSIQDAHAGPIANLKLIPPLAAAVVPSTVGMSPDSSQSISSVSIPSGAPPTVNDLNDPTILKTKNKYFPLLFADFVEAQRFQKEHEVTVEKDKSSTQFSVKKENHPVLSEISLPYSFSQLKSPHSKVQSSNFEDITLDPTTDTKVLSHIKNLFLKSWQQERIFLRAKSKIDIAWPINLIDSLDTLYILGLKKDFVESVELISMVNFKVPPPDYEYLDLKEMSTKILGGLLSAYELSKEPILLEKAKDLANLLLYAFDTPNRIPIQEFLWKTTLANRFPYQNSKLGKLTSMSLEFIRLSQLTGQNKYFDAIFRIYKTIADSSNEFSIDYLFPNLIDASGCKLFSEAEISMGDHIRDSKVMKSINIDLNFIQCHQSGKFTKSLLDTTTNSKIEKFDMTIDSISVYSNLAKMKYLLNDHDLLSLSGNSLLTQSSSSNENTNDNNEKRSSPLDEEKKKQENLEKIPIKMKQEGKKEDTKKDTTTKQQQPPQITSKKIFTSALESIKNLMFFHPITPLEDNNNLTLISSLETKSWFVPTTNEMKIDIKPQYDLNIDSCSLASVYALGSKIFNVTEYLDIAENLVSSCVNVSSLFDDILPEHSYFDPCIKVTGEESCIFNKEAKINKIQNGFYSRDDSKDGMDRIKVSEKSLKQSPLYDDERQHERPTKVLSISVKDKKSVINITPDSIDANGNWILGETEEGIIQPLWVNHIEEQKRTILSPAIIESVFYMYRITGEVKWKNIGQKMFENLLKYMQEENASAKNVWSVHDVNAIAESDSDLPSYWFSKTLKYYILLFEEITSIDLNKYIITSGGHFIERTNSNSEGKNNKMKEIMTIDDIESQPIV